MSASVRGTSLFKRAWNEIPDIVGGTALALVGTALGVFGVYRYYANGMDNRRYKMGYVVMRPDDPRAAKVHKD